MTPEELTSVELDKLSLKVLAKHSASQDDFVLVRTALRTAWAERDEAVANARDSAGCTHKIWEHNTKLMMERDDQKERSRLATQRIIEAIGSNGPENLEDALGRLLAERDAALEKAKTTEEHFKIWQRGSAAELKRVDAERDEARAERDEARASYVHAAKQRNEAESRHAFCDENKKDLRAHRDRLEKELELLRATK